MSDWTLAVLYGLSIELMISLQLFERDKHQA